MRGSSEATPTTPERHAAGHALREACVARLRGAGGSHGVVLLLGQKALRIRRWSLPWGCRGRCSCCCPMRCSQRVWPRWRGHGSRACMGHREAERGLRAGLLGWQLALGLAALRGHRQPPVLPDHGHAARLPHVPARPRRDQRASPRGIERDPVGHVAVERRGGGDHAGAARLGPPAARPRPRAPALSVRGSWRPRTEGHGRQQGTLRAGGAPGSWRCSAR
jgi:hypothetical protein